MWQNAKTVICNTSDKLKINFTVRWTAHRSNWNKFKFEENNDKAALLKHYANYHEEILVNKPCISDCFRVIFIKQPNKKNLDWRENRWFLKLDAKININKVILPKIK